MEVLDPETGPQVMAPRSANVEIAMSRAAQEVQAAMIIAKRFPRDESEAREKIKLACKSLRLAEDSQYEYARGGTEITGPSIRLLEVVAQRWGNCEGGTIELDQTDAKTIMMAYAIDLESNHREVKIFEVPHVREARGGTTKITSARDIYEIGANMGSRRRRACYQGVIPSEVIDEAVEECNKTLRTDSKEPLADRIVKMVEHAAKFGVTPEMIAKKMGCNVDAISYLKLAKLRRMFTSIKDGMADVEDFFDVPAPTQPLGKSSFGLGKSKTEEKPSAGKATEEKPKVPAEAPTGQEKEKPLEPPTQPPTPTEPTPEEQAQFRERVRAEAAGLPGQGGPEPGQQPVGFQGSDDAVKHADLLKAIDKMAGDRKMSVASRAGLWRQYCGTATRETAGSKELEALVGHLRRMGGSLL